LNCALNADDLHRFAKECIGLLTANVDLISPIAECYYCANYRLNSCNYRAVWTIEAGDNSLAEDATC